MKKIYKLASAKAIYIFALLVLLFGGAYNNLKADSRESDSLALVALYNTTDGPNWKDKWDLNTPLDKWYGVRLKNNRVISIQMSNNKLVGELPQELSNLSDLTYLSLPYNQLRGTIPKEFGNFVNLSSIDLSNNQIKGAIPKELGNLSSLNNIKLNNNQLNDTIPKELGNLKLLRIILLNDNQLIGKIPIELGIQSNLIQLNINNNQLSGEIPRELIYLPLFILNVGNNHLSGEIPIISQKINVLDISNNKFSSGLKNIFSNFSKIKSNYTLLKIENNKFNFDELETPLIANIYNRNPQDSLGEDIDTTAKLNSEFIIETLAGRTLNNRYKWFKDGVEIPNETGSTLVFPSFKRSDEGVYTYEATNTIVKNITLYSRSIRVSIADTTSVEESEEESVSIFPNPARDEVFINLGDTGNIKKIKLLNLLGEEVLYYSQFDINNDNQIKLPLGDLANGVYYLILEKENTQFVKQILISK